MAADDAPPSAADTRSHSGHVAGTRSRDPAADSLFFPAACLFAMLAVPIWLAAQQGWPPAAFLAGSPTHAHEMIFGYALAVVAGFLLTRIARPRLALLFASWLAARLAVLVTPGHGWLVALPNLLFVGLFAWFAAPPFLRAAKKFQNRVIGPLLIGFVACAVIYALGASGLLGPAQHTATLLAVDLLALLMLIMGGRAIPPAVAGYYHRQGKVLTERVQPELERLAILCMLATIVCDAFPATRMAAGAFQLAAAVISARRAFAWQLWTVRDRADLWTLGLGYLWLIGGLAIKGLTTLLWPHLLIHALHGITVGALGSLTIAMMARARRQRLRKPLTDFAPVGRAVLLVSGAGLLRLLAPFAPGAYPWLLWATAALWCAAFALLLHHLLAPDGPRDGRARERLRP